VLVIFGVSLLALLFFIGLAVDAGSLYVTYGQLKRAVDAAAVAAANDFKLHSDSESMAQRVTSMTAAASEVLKLQNVDLSVVNLTVLTCTLYDSGSADEIAYESSLQANYPDFYNKCPHGTETLRKLVYVSATQKAPLYFLSLLGFQWARLSTNSVSEAASVDLVLVFDVSGSMSVNNYTNLDNATDGKYINAYNPNETAQYTGCNVDSSCQPLQDAKNAAQALLSHLFKGYDQVAIVTFDSKAQEVFGLGQGGENTIQEASNAINTVQVHWDAPAKYMWSSWTCTPSGCDFAFNPVNPEDRDGDGSDNDPALPAYNPATCPASGPNAHWDTSDGDPYGWGGIPCDDPGALDAYNPTAWAADYGATGDINTEQGYLNQTKTTLIDANGDSQNYWSLSPNSTCTGCGIRLASDILRSGGRSGSVWVMVFLSDGLVNLTDTAGSGGTNYGDTQSTLGGIPSAYPNGFCNGGFKSTNWLNDCAPSSWVSTSVNLTSGTIPRVCIDTSWTTCPPSIHATYQAGDSDKYETTPNTTDYNTLDYALDMTDTAGLIKSVNPNEPRGNDLAIYSIGLGSQVGGDTGTQGYIGEQLLRYIAAVGDDGDRVTDPCSGINTKTSCGNYYYASGGANLLPIYEDIANRIYTRITE
jgi:hypothetical protein